VVQILNSLTSIRTQIEAFLRQNKLTLRQFSAMTGINQGSISNILNGHRFIAIGQLDEITSGMGLPEGHFYELYIDECLFVASPHWRRIGAYLERCAQLNRLDCIKRVVNNLMDNLAYAPMLFEKGELFYEQGYFEAARILYTGVAESERYQHSERLALCQYRLFKLNLCEDQSKNFIAALTFEPFVDRLDEGYQLEAYRELINVNTSLHRFDIVDLLAEKLVRRALSQHKNQSKKVRLKEEGPRPLLFYILYGYLIQANVCLERGQYEQFYHFITLSHQVDWLDDPTEVERKVIAQFSEWARGNNYLYRLMSGKEHSLDEYVAYLTDTENEKFLGLCHIMLAANMYQYDVDYILEQFSEYLVFSEQKSEIGKVNEQFTADQYSRLLAELGTYYLCTDRIQTGLNYVLKSLSFCIKIGSDRGIIRCVGLFEQFRDFTSTEMQCEYKNLIGEVHKINENKISCSITYS
jgi:transcriptional regulator with XRE-family HTH domain